MPQNESEWKMVAKEFNDKWNFPNCVSAFDGKHVALQAPIDSGTEYFNYNGFLSIVLFAVVDTNYNFTYVNVGCQGRILNGGVFSETKFKNVWKITQCIFPVHAHFLEEVLVHRSFLLQMMHSSFQTIL
jgi:hypothetical protein